MIGSGIGTVLAIVVLAATLLSLMQIVWVHTLPQSGYSVYKLVRDGGGCERFIFFFVLETNCIRQPERQPPSSSYNHKTQITLRTSVSIIRACKWLFLTANLKCTCYDSIKVSVLWLQDKVGSCLSGWLQQLVFL